MSDLTTAQKAAILVDGEPLTAWDSITSSDPGILAILNVSGTAYVSGQAAGEALITVGKDGRTGSATFTVSESPLVVTLGTPEPK